MGSDEYIKKQTAYEILDKMEKINNRNPGGLIGDTVKVCIRCVRDNIRFAHAEDVVPVRHGTWDDKKVAFYFKCSECGCCVRSFAGDAFLDYAQTWNYCPNCGALMDKDGDGD